MLLGKEKYLWGWQIYAYMMLQCSFDGAIPTATFAAAPEAMEKPALAGLGMAVIMFGQTWAF
jgi:hypothetical protein